MSFRRDWKSNKGSKLHDNKFKNYYNLPKNMTSKPDARDIIFEYKIKRIIELEFSKFPVTKPKNKWYKWIKT